MFTEEQIKQLRQVMQEENAPVIKRLDNLDAGQAHTNTALEALAEGQKDIRRSVVKELKHHERRITELEEQAHSHKN